MRHPRSLQWWHQNRIRQSLFVSSWHLSLVRYVLPHFQAIVNPGMSSIGHNQSLRAVRDIVTTRSPSGSQSTHSTVPEPELYQTRLLCTNETDRRHTSLRSESLRTLSKIELLPQLRIGNHPKREGAASIELNPPGYKVSLLKKMSNALVVKSVIVFKRVTAVFKLQKRAALS